MPSEFRSSIFLSNVRLYAYHGVMEQERRVGAWFVVSVAVGYDISQAMETDEVTHTLSYADLLDVLKREMAVPSNLLEHVCGRIVSAIRTTFPQVYSIELKLTKLNPPMGADCDGAGVELYWSNKDK